MGPQSEAYHFWNLHKITNKMVYNLFGHKFLHKIFFQPLTTKAKPFSTIANHHGGCVDGVRDGGRDFGQPHGRTRSQPRSQAMLGLRLPLIPVLLWQVIE